VIGRRAPFLIKRMSPARAALGAGLLTTIITVTFVAALVTFTSAQTASAIRAAFSRPGPLAETVAGSIDPAQQTSATRVIRDQLRLAFRDVPFSLYGSLRVDGLALRGAQALPVSGANHRQIATVVAAQALSSHAILVAGHWPVSPASVIAHTRPGAAGQPPARLQQPVPAALSANAAAQLHVTAGSVIKLHSPYDQQMVRVQVTGIFRPADAADPYWQIDPLHTAGVQRGGGFTTYGPLFTTSAVMQTGPLAGVLATWVAVPRPAGHVSAAELLPLSSRLSGALSHVSKSAEVGHPITTSSLPQLLSRLSAGVIVVRSLLLIGLLELLVLTAAALVLMARRLAGERRSETALMRARGGAERQLTVLGAAEGLLLVVPAAVIGPMLGSWLAAGVAHGWPAPLSALEPPSMAWTVSFAVAGMSLLLMLPASLRAAVSPLSVALLRGRQQAVGLASRAGADLALVALAATALWQLAHTASNFTVSETGQVSLNPILVAAPVLAAPACSVLILRALPLASRLANRVAARARRVVLPLASWSIGRRPLRQAGALLITVISLVTAMLALSQFQTGQKTAQDLATFSTGSDYRLDLTDGPLPPGQAGLVAALPGPATSMPVLRTSAAFSDSGTVVSVLGLTAAQAPSAVLMRPDLSGQPLATLSAMIAPAPVTGNTAAGAVLPGRPQRAEITATLSPVRGLTFPLLQLQVRDRAGVYYDVIAGTLRADGRPHTLIAPLALGGHAAYPLRLAGVQLTFAPPHGRLRVGTLRAGKIRLAATARGPFPASARPVRGLLPAAAVRFQAGPNGTPQGASVAEISWLRRTAVLPAIATRAFLAASHQRVGSLINLPVGGQPVRMRIVASVSAFPTIPPGDPGLIVDGGPVQQNLMTAGLPPLPAAQWWVRTAHALRIRGAIPGLQVTGRAAVAAATTGSLFDQDVAEALAAVALAAVLLAIAGFALTAAATRERKPELALLDALGMPRGQLRRMLCTEQLLMAVPSAATGLLLGLLLAHLIVPSLTITPTGGIPALPVLVQIPWTAAALIAAIIAVFPVLIAPLAARTGDTIAVLRQGAQE
jgi:hypothetical protein